MFNLENMICKPFFSFYIKKKGSASLNVFLCFPNTVYSRQLHIHCLQNENISKDKLFSEFWAEDGGVFNN